MSADLTFEQFAEMIGATVSLVSDDRASITLRVIEAEPATGSRPDQVFSVLFQGPAPLLGQGTYSMDLGPLGSHSLFIVPVAEANGEFVYEAVFSRLAD